MKWREEIMLNGETKFGSYKSSDGLIWKTEKEAQDRQRKIETVSVIDDMILTLQQAKSDIYYGGLHKDELIENLYDHINKIKDVKIC